MHGALQLSLHPLTITSPNVASTSSYPTDLTDMTTKSTDGHGRYRFDKCTCQYHSEKFVTRKEYDEIKDSLSRLENILTTTSPTGQGGASGSATEEVAAAVNIVKKQAGFLSKVISDTPSTAATSAAAATASDHHRNRGQSISYATAASSLPVGISSSSSSSHGHNRNHLGSGGDSGGNNGSFAYQPFSLNVPSQSGGGLSDTGDDEYYGNGGGQRNTISSHSHSTSTEFSRPPSSTFPNHHQQHQHQHHHLQPAQISGGSGGGHFQTNIPPGSYTASTYSSRIPEINLGGLVVEDQSSRGASSDLYKSPHDPSDSLSTLANLANASSMASSSRRSSTGHLQPGHHQNPSMGLTSPSLTLAPIGSQDISRPASLSLSTAGGGSGGSSSVDYPPSVAPPRLPPGGPPGLAGSAGQGREAQLQHVLQTSVPRREICDRLVEYYVRIQPKNNYVYQ